MENPFPLLVESSQDIPDDFQTIFQNDFQTIFQNDFKLNENENDYQIVLIESSPPVIENNETMELESETELGPPISSQKSFPLNKETVEALLDYNLSIRAILRKGVGKKGGASSKKLIREVKALHNSWEKEALIRRKNR